MPHADPAFPPAATEKRTLVLRFDAQPDTVEGILAVVQEWAAQEGLVRDDGLSLRLVLDELLSNICMHGAVRGTQGKVDLRLERLLADRPRERPGDKDLPASAQGHGATGPRPPQGVVRIVLRDTGKPFNPLAYESKPVAGIRDTPVGGRGLTLVRLLTARTEYQWTGSGNQLCLELPLNGRSVADTGSQNAASPAAKAGNMLDRLRAIWFGNLALRQTVVFTLCSVALIWGAMALYSLEVENVRAANATARAMQAMHTQSVISSTFITRVGDAVERLARNARLLPDIAHLAADPDALLRQLQNGPTLHSLVAEIPVIGVVTGCGGKTWLYRMRDGEPHRDGLERDLTPLVASGAAPSRWQRLPMTFGKDDPHAAMLYAVPLTPSGRPEDGWIGTIIVMPWIDRTLHALAGFQNAVPFLLDHTGQYVIYPVGRRMGNGPQSLADEARQDHASGILELEKKILAGGKGVVQLRPTFHGDATPWPLPWEGPTSLAYYPMGTPGWSLALLVSSEELGDAPQELPRAFFLMAILGPLCIGCVTWLVTSRTLRPLHDLASCLERFGQGDMGAPVPKARYADEIGRMLDTFERVRVTLRASFRNLVNSAAAEQRMRNELELARNIQRSMLPAVFPRLPWACVHAGLDMCREVCGDLHDCFVPDPADPTRICCLMGDVCGKGIPAAIVMSRTMSLARAFLLAGLSPAETLSRLNSALLRRENSSMFVTMLVGVLDRDGTFTWASAGHPPPLPGPEPEGDGFSPCAARPLPWPGELVLGVRDGQRYSTFRLALKPGQSLLLYTDGADEAQAPPASGNAGVASGGELFGEARLAGSFDRACREVDPDAGLEGIVARLREDLARHMAGRPATDDISLMVITRTRQGGDQDMGIAPEPPREAGHPSSG
ncbi:SpoIIE family protein phosphatase [Solidesulfovibrio sp. C21]|uniref:SpoIIE family protein phosphatase n=1 Tax=Solidesulfovibrio sp. C21 TaxID=3398613 RepID=UPI0039FC8DAF